MAVGDPADYVPGSRDASVPDMSGFASDGDSLLACNHCVMSSGIPKFQNFTPSDGCSSIPLITCTFPDVINALQPLLPDATSHAIRYLRAMGSPEPNRLEMLAAPDLDPAIDIDRRSNANPPRP